VTRALSSSTALLEEVGARRRQVIGSAATAPEVIADFYTVPLSAEMPRMRRFGTPLEFLPAERQGVLVAGNILQQYVQHSAQRMVDLVMPQRATRPFVGFRVIVFQATTTGNVLVFRPAVMPISGLPALLSSTDPELGASRLIRGQFSEAVALAAEEWFEDGVESRFSRALSSLLHAYAEGAVAAVEAFVDSPGTNVDVAVEAAKWLGGVDHAATKLYRRTLLEKMLNSPVARLRQGAAAGLASMDDPDSLDVLRRALDREPNRMLRGYLQLVANQLERTRACLNL
jgi:hypothetical protein